MTMTAKSSDPMLGRVIDDRYQIVRKIARGGMATVYLANDLRLARTVAVKVMHENLGSDPDFVTRFDREARAAARLSHPNVVSVFDRGIDDERPYIVMEYVEGTTLRQAITREAPMKPARAVELITQVAAAVSAAHEAGIIHRDLKPENVLISTRGQVKVADFGLARAVTAHTATAQGMLIGTVSYISPELVTRGHADTRCDVYALGVVLYEMLTGLKPHTGETPIQVAYSHVHNEITEPSAAAPAQWRGTSAAVPDYLDALVLAAAAREPDDRPADAGVLLTHLEDAGAALAKGVANDPILASRMQLTTVDDSVTDYVPHQPPAERSEPTNRTLPLTESEAPDSGPSTQWPDISPSAEPVRERQARRRRHGRRLLTLLLLASVLLGVGAWYWLSGRFTDTPDFTNLTQAKAAALAGEKGFPITFADEYSETVTVGQVVRTDPAAGSRISIGGTITAYLSKGLERYAVPSLAGRTVDEAKTTLTDAHLTVGKVTEVWNDSVTIGQVVSSSIDAGTLVKPDVQIDLNVSRGPAPIKIASYVNKSFDSAKTYYEAKGVTVARGTDQFSNTVASGNVISQDPAKGTTTKGSTITFIVSKGPEYVTIPGVRGTTKDQAVQALEAVGLVVTVSQRGWFGSSALGTNPAEGTKVKNGSAVTLYVG
jgi:eukaryotic-like serine/threonine-protein kinase